MTKEANIFWVRRKVARVWVRRLCRVEDIAGRLALWDSLARNSGRELLQMIDTEMHSLATALRKHGRS